MRSISACSPASFNAGPWLNNKISFDSPEGVIALASEGDLWLINRRVSQTTLAPKLGRKNYLSRLLPPLVMVSLRPCFFFHDREPMPRSDGQITTLADVPVYLFMAITKSLSREKLQLDESAVAIGPVNWETVHIRLTHRFNRNRGVYDSQVTRRRWLTRQYLLPTVWKLRAVFKDFVRPLTAQLRTD